MKIEITKELAKKLYNTLETPVALKEILEENFGKTSLKKKSWKDIKSFEDALEVLGKTKEEVYDGTTNKRLINQLELEIIIEAINEGWVLDFNNKNLRKYYVWFGFSGSGFSFSDTSYSYGNTSAYIGSRFLFESGEKAEYYGKTFEKKHGEYLLSK